MNSFAEPISRRVLREEEDASLGIKQAEQLGYLAFSTYVLWALRKSVNLVCTQNASRTLQASIKQAILQSGATT